MIAVKNKPSILAHRNPKQQNLFQVKVMDTPICTDPHNSVDRIMVLLNGMGEYKGEPVRIHVNESVRPVAQPYCRILFHMRKQVECKLDN